MNGGLKENFNLPTGVKERMLSWEVLEFKISLKD